MAISEKELDRRIGIEIVAVLFAFWLPAMVGSTSIFLQGSGDGPHTWISSSISGLAYFSECCLIGYLIWVFGRRLSDFGLVGLTWKDAGFGLAFFVVYKLFSIGYRLAILTYFHLSPLPLIFRFQPVNPIHPVLVHMIPTVLFEEMLFRVYLQARLRDLGWEKMPIVVTSAILFTLPHIYQGPRVFPPIFVFGILSGALIFKTKSIWPGLLGHWLSDLTIFVYPWI